MAYKFNPFTGNLDVVGPVLTGTGTVSAAADGTAQVPGINFANDLDTGITRTGVDQIAISTGGNGRLFIDSSGNVGIGTTSPGNALVVREAANANDSAYIEIVSGNNAPAGVLFGDTDASPRAGIFYHHADESLRFYRTGFNESARIDSSGRLLVGTSSARAIGTGNFQFQAEGSGTLAGISTTRNDNNASSSNIRFVKTRGTTAGSTTIVQSGDGLGILSYWGTDGTNAIEAASILAEVDGTPGANDMPGRLKFSTTPDGDSSPDEVMRITSDKYVRLASGTGGIQFNGDTAVANALDDYEEGTWDFAITTAGGSVTMDSSFNACSYTKIGRIVHVGGLVTVSSVSSPTGFIAVTLPFTPANLSEYAEYNAGAVTIGNSASKNANDFAILVQDNGEMRIYIADVTVLSSTNANAQQLQANSIISFQLTYVAA